MRAALKAFPDWVDIREDAKRLHGGEESAAYRVGAFVVRVGPSWRTKVQAQWSHQMAMLAAKSVPEVVTPLTTRSGETVVVAGGHPLTLWPLRHGVPANKHQAGQLEQAAELLARIHEALAGEKLGPPPPPSRPLAPFPELDDPDLDRCLQEFDRSHPDRQGLHGDYYQGNVLVNDHDGRITTVLDWDEAFIGPPQREVAWAAWEWGDGLHSLDLSAARRFVVTYEAAGGPGIGLDEETLCQLVRQRLRSEAQYRAALESPAADDQEYEVLQRRAYFALDR